MKLLIAALAITSFTATAAVAHVVDKSDNKQSKTSAKMQVAQNQKDDKNKYMRPAPSTSGPHQSPRTTGPHQGTMQ